MTRPKVHIRDRDLGWNKLRKRLRQQKVVEVGIRGDHKNNRDDGEIDNVGIATIHEFGAIVEKTTADGAAYAYKIPERSFIRDPLDDNKLAIQRIQKRLAAGVYALKITPKKALEIIGLKAQSLMRRAIQKGLSPGLAASTIAGREHGGTKPLLDTKQLLGSITYEVVNK